MRPVHPGPLAVSMGRLTEKKARNITGWVIVCCLAVIGLYDIAALWFPGRSMVSHVVLDFAGENPIVPFLFGVICGHLFWPQTRLLAEKK